jgi:hypothetical protein
MTIERISSAQIDEEERSLESTVRPRRLDEFAGQERVKENLAILIDAARQRSEPVDHVLLYGPQGLARRRWPISSPPRWARRSGRRRAQPSSGPATWRLS